MTNMTLRMTADTEQALRALAEGTHRSLNDAASEAILAAAQRMTVSERYRAAFADVAARDRDALDLLSQ